jgi:formylmethanofuran dehydrogenase subunit C
MSLKLMYRGQTSIPVEIQGFTPNWACDKSLAEIERFRIFHGNQNIPLAEMFNVTGDASDQQFEFEGDLSGVHWIGAEMSAGRIRIQGSTGRHVGSEMTGGEILVDGDASIWLGAEMHGGFIHVKGRAGNLVGAAYRGSVKGMTAGTILVDGDAGNEIGLSMRRGLIAVGGSAGDVVGFNMIAGSVLVFGDSGVRPGAGMRRGTIGLFGPNPPHLLPSFRYTSTCQPQFVLLMLRTLQRKGFRVAETLFKANFDLHRGDLVTVGRGEILHRSPN